MSMVKYLRVSLGGPLLSGERWSINPGFTYQPALGTFTQGALTAAAEAVAAVTIPTILLDGLSSKGSLVDVRVEARDNTVLEGVGVANKTTGNTGAGNVTLTPQSAVVVSLITGNPTRHGRGRLYWPAVGYPLATDTGRLATGKATAIAGGMKTYLRGVQDALKSGLEAGPGSALVVELQVVSKTTSQAYRVNTLRVGDVVDTQRRRRDRMPETYSNVGFYS